jgi:hypothetical protein
VVLVDLDELAAIRDPEGGLPDLLRAKVCAAELYRDQGRPGGAPEPSPSLPSPGSRIESRLKHGHDQSAAGFST